MRIPSGVTDQYIYFVAVDATDLKTRETGLSTWTVYRSRNGAAAVAITTPTINETDNVNMPGVYELLLDEDMTIAAGNDSEEMCFHITHAGMAPVTRVIELYRPKLTAGYTLGVESDGDLTKVNTLNGQTAQTGDSYARLGAPAGASIAADLLAIDNFVDELESRLSAARAGYLDELGAANIPANIDTLLTRLSAARAGYLDELAAANLPANIDTLLARITAAVALASVCTEARLAELDAANLPTITDGIKAKTDNQPAGVPKNVALSNFMFLMMDSADHITPKTGLTITEEISKDGGAFAACANAFAEVSDGMYKINFTQAEMNADIIVLKFAAAGADDRLITIITSS